LRIRGYLQPQQTINVVVVYNLASMKTAAVCTSTDNEQQLRGSVARRPAPATVHQQEHQSANE